MESQPGWRPLRKPSRPAEPPSAFSRLALVHAFALAGDTLITIALADSLFFSIRPGEARVRVALYLLLTIAPFAVVAPLLAPALDGSRGGRRGMAIAALAGRSFACLLMADDLNGLLLFPEAFAVLVLSKTYMITKSALVPTVVSNDEELVQANSKLALIGVVMGFVAAGPGIGLLQTAGADWTLRLGFLVFAAGAVSAWFVPRAEIAAEPEDELARSELRAAGIVLAASAMAVLRGVVGFMTFLVAFTFRSGGAPSWWFGVVLAASAAGFLVGAVAAPWLRARTQEEHILFGALATVVVVGAWAALAAGRPSAAAMAATVGVAASAGKLAFDSLVQRDAPDAARGRSFARFETRFQLAWVVGAFVPVVIPLPLRAGLVVIAMAAAFAAVSYGMGRRMAAAPPPPASP